MRGRATFGASRRRPAAIAAAATAAALLLSPTQAGAVVTFGSNLNSTANASVTGAAETATIGSLPVLNQEPGGVTSPIDGVIVRWRIKMGALTIAVTPRVVRPGASQSATGGGTGETVVPAVSQVSVFPTRLPVRAGDGIGVDFNGTMGSLTSLASTVGASEFSWQPPLQDGAPPATGNSTADREDLFNADVEPDCDSDGFGDETQDPSVDGCSPPPPDTTAPDTTITKRPKDKTKKKQATFEFTANEAGATFGCSLDGAAFAPCTSPDTLKVKKGKHNFQVRARDAAGNVDPTEAVDSWKVKKKRRK